MTNSKSLTGAALFGAILIGSLFSSSSPHIPAPALTNETWDNSCTISKSTAFEIYPGPNTFTTSSADHLNANKILPNINSSNWKQWEFDGTSHTGLSSVLLVFGRDSSYQFFRQGNLRVEFYIALPDGNRVAVLDYAAESTLINCPGRYTAGVWNGTDHSYSFLVDAAMKHAQLRFDSPKIRGSLNLTSDTNDSYLADGTAWEQGKEGQKGAVQVAPGLNYAVPIPGRAVQMDATLESGKKLIFKGRGGATRLWATTGWLNLCGGWKNIRGWAGPYTIVYWKLLLVGTRKHRTSDKEKQDYTEFTDLFGGEVKGSFADQSTGHIFVFASPSRNKKWSFDIEHMHSYVEFRAPGVDEYGNKKLGQSGFTNRVGRGITEKCRWPAVFGKVALAITSGAGFFGPRFQHLFIRVVGYRV
ncbi:hypothetical protein QBC38DRAFT_508777 [Podospora fimiseda]|uniref:AttH domain-containing protein n=1 Tax=Podospora fimiseda TaxID=252190 RepID=A0AAN7BSD9_9PEZI|nr:hypothetical protein QBC38DRAFT_508777 [Podospora fimiseda]